MVENNTWLAAVIHFEILVLKLHSKLCRAHHPHRLGTISFTVLVSTVA